MPSMPFGKDDGEPPRYSYCDGEGGLDNGAARTRLAAIGVELRARAPGQPATIFEARDGRVRMTQHLIEEDMKGFNVSPNFT